MPRYIPSVATMVVLVAGFMAACANGATPLRRYHLQPVTAPQKPDPKKEDAKLLQGTWKVLKSQFPDGSKTKWIDASIGPDFSFTFAAELTITHQKMSRTFAVTLFQDEKAISLVSAQGARDKLERGIYQLDGDRLTICMSDDHQLPKDFSPTAPAKYRFVLERVEAPQKPEPKKDEVAQLLKRLDDPSEAVRNAAIGEIRLLARRVDITSAQRVQKGSEFAPKVNGLVPHLIRAVEDKAELNRFSALYALADTLDPVAVAAIRGRLKDESAKVRLTAACLLTEFKHASGLPEMKQALAKMRNPTYDMSFDAEMLLASFERITGKSFGEIPTNPGLYSNRDGAAAAERRYRHLLDTWAAWWAWQPPTK